MGSSQHTWSAEERLVLDQINSQRMPKHIAIIMDGNGRWAKERKLPRIRGHQKGVRVTRDIITCVRQLGVPYLTLYAFSEENWTRPKLEISALMKLLESYVVSERTRLMENDIRLTTIGNRDKLHAGARKKLEQTMEMTRNNKTMVLSLALSYSGRDEIVRAVNTWAENRRDSEEITAETLSQHLDTSGYPDPDLLIRTSGELRISNYMLWQLAYAELYFTDTLWPDFNEASLLQAVLAFQNRKRRFGGIDEKIEPNRSFAGSEGGT